MMMGPVNFVNLQKHRLKRCGAGHNQALDSNTCWLGLLIRLFVQPCSSSIWRCSIIDGIDIWSFEMLLWIFNGFLFWEALMMMGPVNFKIAIWSVACDTDGLMTGHCDFRRNMQGVLAMWQHRAGLVLLLHQSEVQHICNRFDCCYNCILNAYVDTTVWSTAVARGKHSCGLEKAVFT